MKYIDKITRSVVGLLFNFNSIVLFKRSSRKVKRFISAITGKKTADTNISYTNDKVSIIIGIYNDTVGFNKSVESALSQTYRDLEVIVAIDHSFAPGAMKILDGYKANPRLKVFIQSPY